MSGLRQGFLNQEMVIKVFEYSFMGKYPQGDTPAALTVKTQERAVNVTVALLGFRVSMCSSHTNHSSRGPAETEEAAARVATGVSPVHKGAAKMAVLHPQL